MFKINLLTIVNLICVHSCTDHYWRDYDGRIPHDAIKAGYNNNTNCPLYIGQAYVHHYGLLLGTITPGSMEIHIPCYGVVNTKVIIKILCSPDPSNYIWLPTTAATFKDDVEGEIPILGGYDRKNWETTGSEGTLNIGRIMKDGRPIISNIGAYSNSDVWFYYPFKGKELRASQYEVMVFRGISTKLNEFQLGC
nr:uncharacterized protein LOC111502142 [Leptinotarsa decemlineata]